MRLHDRNVNADETKSNKAVPQYSECTGVLEQISFTYGEFYLEVITCIYSGCRVGLLFIYSGLQDCLSMLWF